MFVKGMLDGCDPQATKVRWVMDNLNTHSAASLYEAFEPEEARRLARRFEIHSTPKHGSWLNIAEIELSALIGAPRGERIYQALAGKRRERTRIISAFQHGKRVARRCFRAAATRKWRTRILNSCFCPHCRRAV